MSVPDSSASVTWRRLLRRGQDVLQPCEGVPSSPTVAAGCWERSLYSGPDLFDEVLVPAAPGWRQPPSAKSITSMARWPEGRDRKGARRPVARKSASSPFGDNSNCLFRARVKATRISGGASSHTASRTESLSGRRAWRSRQSRAAPRRRLPRYATRTAAPRGPTYPSSALSTCRQRRLPRLRCPSVPRARRERCQRLRGHGCADEERWPTRCRWRRKPNLRWPRPSIPAPTDDPSIARPAFTSSMSNNLAMCAPRADLQLVEQSSGSMQMPLGLALALWKTLPHALAENLAIAPGAGQREVGIEEGPGFLRLVQLVPVPRVLGRPGRRTPAPPPPEDQWLTSAPLRGRRRPTGCPRRRRRRSPGLPTLASCPCRRRTLRPRPTRSAP